MDFVCAAGYTGYHSGPPSSQFPHSSEDGARHKTTRGDERAQSSLHSAAAASMARSVARARRALASILVLPAAAMVSLARLFASLAVFLNREETRRAASSVPSRQAGSGIGRTPKNLGDSDDAPWAQEPPQNQQEAQVRVPATFPGALRPMGALEPLSTGPRERRASGRAAAML